MTGTCGPHTAVAYCSCRTWHNQIWTWPMMTCDHPNRAHRKQQQTRNPFLALTEQRTKLLTKLASSGWPRVALWGWAPWPGTSSLTATPFLCLFTRSLVMVKSFTPKGRGGVTLPWRGFVSSAREIFDEPEWVTCTTGMMTRDNTLKSRSKRPSGTKRLIVGTKEQNTQPCCARSLSLSLSLSVCLSLSLWHLRESNTQAHHHCYVIKCTSSMANRLKVWSPTSPLLTLLCPLDLLQPTSASPTPEPQPTAPHHIPWTWLCKDNTALWAPLLQRVTQCQISLWYPSVKVAGLNITKCRTRCITKWQCSGFFSVLSACYNL